MPPLARARAMRVFGVIGPPRELVGLVRWAALAVVLVVAGRLIGTILFLFSEATSPTPKFLATLALAWLCWRWLRGYALGGFAVVGCLSEGAALLVLGLVLDDPLDVLGVLYIALAFRSLYGSVRDALGVSLVYLAAHLGGVALSAAAGPDSLLRPEVLQQGPGVLVVARLMQFLAVTLTRNGRAAACERTLEVARAALAVAVDEAGIYAAALEAGLGLVATGCAAGKTAPDAGLFSENRHALESLGLLLALDDFGTGYSSLGYLQRFPLDILKIDKSFVDHITDRSDRAGLARAIIQLGKTLKLRVVAEGVEQKEQADVLTTLGCDLGQGYYFDRPLDAAAMTELLHETSSARAAGTLLGLPRSSRPNVAERHAA